MPPVTATRLLAISTILLIISSCSSQVEDEANTDLQSTGTSITEIHETPLPEDTSGSGASKGSSSEGSSKDEIKKEKRKRTLKIVNKPGTDRLLQNGPTAAQIERVRLKQEKKRQRRKSAGNNAPIQFENDKEKHNIR